LNLANEDICYEKKSGKQQSDYDFYYGLGESESQLNRYDEVILILSA
jgi:hypothetical protein